MKKLSIAAFAVLFMSPHAVYAQLMDQVIGGGIGTGTELGATAQHSPSNDEIMGRLQIMGYSNIAPSPDVPHQFLATNSEGMNVGLSIDPRTGQIMGAVPR